MKCILPPSHSVTYIQRYSPFTKRGENQPGPLFTIQNGVDAWMNFSELHCKTKRFQQSPIPVYVKLINNILIFFSSWRSSLLHCCYQCHIKPVSYKTCVYFSLFSYIFKRANIFSFIDFPAKYLQHRVSCGVFYHINQGDYSEFHFNQRSLISFIKSFFSSVSHVNGFRRMQFSSFFMQSK